MSEGHVVETEPNHDNGAIKHFDENDEAKRSVEGSENIYPIKNMNNSMMLPQVVKAPNFPKKIKRNNHVSANRSTSQTNRFNSHSERRIKLNTGSSLHRPAFNSNFSSRNSMAKRFKRKLFKTGAEVTKDFDPNTVYDGIEEIDLDLEEMEENMDNLDDTGLEETESDRLDEEIEILMEANK